jgi:hypothetical protein
MTTISNFRSVEDGTFLMLHPNWVALLVLFQLANCFSWNFTEPSENWTIEELMNWCLLKSQTATDEKLAALLEAMDQKFQQGKTDVLNFQENALAKTESSNNSNSNNNNTSNTSNKVKYIHVTISTGPHASDEPKVLAPTEKVPCWVGRSGSKRFRDKGLSLRKDLEVSTTHGKFELVRGKPFFTDTGSSNGTSIDGAEIVPNQAYELKEGMKLMFGSTLCTISLEMV